MASVLYVVGYCTSCETGPLGVRICGDCCSPVVLCDECDALWNDPDLEVKPSFPKQPHVPCPSCGSSLNGAGSHWASFDEIETAGWQSSIKEVGRPFQSSEDS